MNQDGVNAAFDLMKDEIGAVIKQLNEEGAALFKGGDYAKAQKLGVVGTALGEFTGKLEQLKAEWNRGFDAATRRRVGSGKADASTPSHTKRHKTILQITFPDGTCICERVAAKSFVQAIEKLGVERVKQLGLVANGVPLVSATLDDAYASSRWPCGKFHVLTHSSTEGKRDILLQVGKTLGVQLSVKVVSPAA